MDIKPANRWRDPPLWDSYKIKIERMIGCVNYEELCEIHEWLKENITGRWVDRTFIVEGQELVGPCFYFEHKCDAIAFKMRWL